MDRSTLELADIFRRYGDAYRDAVGAALSTAQQRVMTAIETCRTAVLGGHVEQCDTCGQQRIAYNSCLMESARFWGVRSRTGVTPWPARPFCSPLLRGLEPRDQRVSRSEYPLPETWRHNGLDRFQLLAGIRPDIHLGRRQLAVPEPQGDLPDIVRAWSTIMAQVCRSTCGDNRSPASAAHVPRAIVP